MLLGLIFFVFGRLNTYPYAFIFANSVTNNRLMDVGVCAIVRTFMSDIYRSEARTARLGN